MVDIAQKKALRNYRRRLAKRGMARFGAANKPPKKTILTALRRSPLVGADLNLTRQHETGRKVDL